MILLTKLIALVFVVYGCVLVLRPTYVHRLFDLVNNEKMPYFAAGAKAVTGIVLIASSSACRIPWIVGVFGGVAVIAGLLILVVKRDVFIGSVRSLEKRNDEFFKAVGIGVLSVGVILIYAV